MRTVVIAVLAIVAAVVGISVLPSGDGRYRLDLALKNAEGLREGSTVVVGGVRVGKVKKIHIRQPGDRVVAELRLDDKAAPVGRNVNASISAVNLLGQKQVDLAVGDRSKPAPSGYTVPTSRVISSTDLDQVLNVLGPDTRTRLAVFLNEAGIAVGGRKMDLRHLLQVLPSGAAELAQFLQDLVHDNQALEHTVQNGDVVLASLNGRRDDITRLVQTIRRASRAVSDRRPQLIQTLSRAPGALSTARAFLAQLDTATKPLGPAARALTAAAAPLRSTLDELEPFREAAAPALASATKVAPSLTQLADGATPILRQARRPVSSLAGFSSDTFPPVANILDNSVDNIISIVANWAHAIQGRDRLSHVFRGEVAFTAEALRSALGRLQPKARSQRRAGRPSAEGAVKKSLDTQAPTPKKPVLPSIHVPLLPEILTQTKEGVKDVRDTTSALLDFLLKP
jgi:virulence factor Mce-like protein